jgi:hypothetical protein
MFCWLAGQADGQEDWAVSMEMHNNVRHNGEWHLLPRLGQLVIIV